MDTQNTDLTVKKDSLQVGNPFLQKKSDAIMQGTVQIEESRAVAETQAKIIIAKRFPRDQHAAVAQIIEACSRKSFAESATYAFPRGGQTISGPSIRLAEELARAWGNISFGTRELSQQNGYSEMQAYAWDMERNTENFKNFTVKHERHTKAGVTALTDPRDVYEVTANNAGRRMRACIIAIVPPDLMEIALEQCRKTLVGDTTEPIKDKINKIIIAFTKHDVTAQMIEAKFKCKLDSITAEQIADLRGIYASIKDGMTKVSDWFGPSAAETPAAVDALNKTAAPTKPAAPAAPKATRRRKEDLSPDTKGKVFIPEPQETASAGPEPAATEEHTAGPEIVQENTSEGPAINEPMFPSDPGDNDNIL